MGKEQHSVDGFRFLPPGLAAWIGTFIPEQFEGDIPWTPMAKPVDQATFALVTSAGISMKTDPPFDMEREKKDPTSGDPTFRSVPRDATGSDIEVNHLHINTTYIVEDINVILPLARMGEFEAEGRIGKLAPTHYSFYGFQWEGTAYLTDGIAPMADQMAKEGVDAVLLTPA